MESPESPKPLSTLERLLTKDFSGDTEKMFNALQSQLKKKAVNAEDCVLEQGVKRGIYLRAFVKGLNSLKKERQKGRDILDGENLFQFKNDGSRDVETLGAFSHNRAISSSRLPLPSLTSVARHLTEYIEVKTIRSKHMRILRLDLQGIYSRKEIAKIIGCSEPTITNVLSSEAIQQFKRRAQGLMEDEYSSLMQPSIVAIRESLKPTQDIGLRQDTAFKYLRSQGRGGDNYVKHEHSHTHVGKDGGPIQVSEVKQKMLQKLGYSPENIIEGEFREVKKAE